MDPRNLVLCFKIIPLICKHLRITPFVEELFEVFSCYFPIDFTPVSWFKMLKSVNHFLFIFYFFSHQMMKTESQRTNWLFFYTPQFAKYAIPLMLDKLESDIDSARLDALLTMTEKMLNSTDALLNAQKSTKPLTTRSILNNYGIIFKNP